MSELTSELKGIFSVKYKPRHDSFSDQYNRLLMSRVFLAAALVTSLDWFQDEIKCIISDAFNDLDVEYVSQACWINGFFIFKELKTSPKFYGYFGLPKAATHNGTYIGNPTVTRTCIASPRNTKCLPMTKIFYLQYQYFPFFLGTVSFLFYIPYLFFLFINTDLMSLKDQIQKCKPPIKDIVNAFFVKTPELQRSQRMKIVFNISVKFLYIFLNVGMFFLIDYMLNGDFKYYFPEWINWSNLPNEDAFNYVGQRKFIKAAENLLPSFGFCDVLEEGADLKIVMVNEHRLICEISQHIMYQYVFLALWLFLVIGGGVSIFGLIALIATYGLRKHLFCKKDEFIARKIYTNLTLRQQEYLDFVYKKNYQVYGSILRVLNDGFIEEIQQTFSGL